MASTPRARCSRCEKRVSVDDLIDVRRWGGGSFRRAHRQYRSRICTSCAHNILETATPGHHSNDRYSVSAIRTALTQHLVRAGVFTFL